jgi:hypothetical protein
LRTNLFIPPDEPDQLPESDPEANPMRIWAFDGDGTTIASKILANKTLPIGCWRNLLISDLGMREKVVATILKSL